MVSSHFNFSVLLAAILDLVDLVSETEVLNTLIKIASKPTSGSWFDGGIRVHSTPCPSSKAVHISFGCCNVESHDGESQCWEHIQVIEDNAKQCAASICGGQEVVCDGVGCEEDIDGTYFK